MQHMSDEQLPVIERDICFLLKNPLSEKIFTIELTGEQMQLPTIISKKEYVSSLREVKTLMGKILIFAYLEDNAVHVENLM